MLIIIPACFTSYIMYSMDFNNLCQVFNVSNNGYIPITNNTNLCNSLYCKVVQVFDLSARNRGLLQGQTLQRRERYVTLQTVDFQLALQFHSVCCSYRQGSQDSECALFVPGILVGRSLKERKREN